MLNFALACRHVQWIWDSFYLCSFPAPQGWNSRDWAAHLYTLKPAWKEGVQKRGGGSVKCLLLGFFLYRGRREDLPQSCCAAQSACKYTLSLLAGNYPRRSKYCYVVSSLSRHLCSPISGQEQNLECPSTAVKPAVMTFPTQPEVQEISQESLFL